MDRLERTAYSLLRIVSGFLFFCHGAAKLFGFAGQQQFSFGDNKQIFIGGVIELVTGGLIALGLLTRPAAFIASGTMAVAYVQFHWKLAFDGYKFLPIVNQGEAAVLYCFLFLLFAIRGAGSASFDHSMRGK